MTRKPNGVTNMDKPLDWEKLKKTRVTVPVVALGFLILFGWQAYESVTGWHFSNFVSVAQAEDIGQQISKNTQAINEHIQIYEITEADKSITSLQDQLFELTQWVSVNGDTDITRQRKEELNRRLVKWQEFKACLVSEGVNCDSVRP